MAWVFDPETGEYYDDGMVGASYLTGGSQNPYMPEESFSGFNLPADYNKYGMEPYEMADVNQQLTGTKSLLAILANPMFNYMTSQAVPGADTFDYESIAGMPSYGQPGIMGGAAGYGGGGGYGGGYGGAVAPPPTPWLTSADSDPVLANIKKAVLAGQNPTQIMSGLLSSTDETNQDVLDGYQSAAYEMFKEKNASDQAMMQMPGTPEQTAAQQWMAKTGLPDPNQLYGAGGGPLPEEFEEGFQGATQADAARLAAMERNLGPMEKRVKDLNKGSWTEDLFGPSTAVRGPLGRDTFGGGDFGGPSPRASAVSAVEPDLPTNTGGIANVGGRMAAIERAAHDADTGITARFSGPGTVRAVHDFDDTGITANFVPPGGALHSFGTDTNPLRARGWDVQQGRTGPAGGGEPAPTRQGGGVGAGGTGLFGNKAPNARYDAGKAKQGSRGFAQRSADAQRRLIKETTARNADADVGGRELLGRYLASQGRSPAKDRMNSQMAMLRMMGIGV